MQTRGEMSLIRFSFYIQTKGSALFLIYIFYKYILLIRTRCFFPCKTLKSFDLSSIVSSIFETVWHWRWLISSKIIRLRQEKEHFTIDFKQNKFQELVSKYLLWTSIFLYKKSQSFCSLFFFLFVVVVDYPGIQDVGIESRTFWWIWKKKQTKKD